LQTKADDGWTNDEKRRNWRRSSEFGTKFYREVFLLILEIPKFSYKTMQHAPTVR